MARQPGRTPTKEQNENEDKNDGDDLLVGTGGDDAIDGGAGNDRILGGGGDDYLEGGGWVNSTSCLARCLRHFPGDNTVNIHLKPPAGAKLSQLGRHFEAYLT